MCKTDDSLTVMEEVKDTICLNSKVNGKQPSLQDRVYSVDGVSTAITTCFFPNIAIPICVAMRGREPQVLTPKRTEFGKAVRKQYENRELNMSRHAMQRLEPRKDGVANTLTSVQKDNLVAMPLRIAEATAQGCQQGVVVTPINPDGECSRTIKAQYQQSSRANFVRQDGLGATGVMESRYRIRKLTPRECFRLMGVDDKDIDTIQASGMRCGLWKIIGRPKALWSN